MGIEKQKRRLQFATWRGERRATVLDRRNDGRSMSHRYFLRRCCVLRVTCYDAEGARFGSCARVSRTPSDVRGRKQLSYPHGTARAVYAFDSPQRIIFAVRPAGKRPGGSCVQLSDARSAESTTVAAATLRSLPLHGGAGRRFPSVGSCSR